MTFSKIFKLSLMLFIIPFVGCNFSKRKTNSSPLTNNKVEKKIEAKKSTAWSKSIEDFVFNDYFILDSVSSESSAKNKFTVLILANKIEKQTDTFSEEHRMLMIIEQTDTGLVQSGLNDNIVKCKSCGGVFGDPYAGIQLEGNVLKVLNYGGSAWRWSEDYTFRYQNEQWELIGAKFESYFNAKDCNGQEGLAGRQLEDINFATSKMQILHTKGDDCKPYEDYWSKFTKKKLIYLNEFPGAPEKWPNGKVKDGDGKD